MLVGFFVVVRGSACTGVMKTAARRAATDARTATADRFMGHPSREELTTYPPSP